MTILSRKNNTKCVTYITLIFVLSQALFYACNDAAPEKTGLEKSAITVKTLDSVVLTDQKTKITKERKSKFITAYDSALTLFQTSYSEFDVQTEYGNAHVITAGLDNAPPLVLLHGMNATSTMWYPNIKALSTHYKIYAIDFLLEPGKSTCISEINDTKSIIDWYFQIFDKLNLKHFSIVGASRGGWLATSISLRQPDRISKLVLLSPAQTFVWIKPNFKIAENIIYSFSPKRKNLRNVLETLTENVDNISQVYLNEFFLASEKAEIKSSILKMRPFSKNEFSSLKMPVLVLIGDNDIINSDKTLSRAKRYLKRVVTKKITHAGHFLSIDQSEIVNNELINFLNQK